MTSKRDYAQTAIDLIGGDEMLTRLRAKKIEAVAEGIQFFVPILGGLVQVVVARGDEHWNIELGLDVLSTVPKRIEEVPDGNLKLIVHHLFVL